MAICSLSEEIVNSLISVPSMVIEPESISYRRGINAVTVDLPPPELPTKATFEPTGTVKLTLCKTSL